MEQLIEFALISTEQTIQYGILGGVAAAAAGGAKLGGIGKLLGGVASGIGSLFGIGRGKRQNRRNRQNMLYQHQLDKQMFDYQNAYNTPAQQMARLKSAGLNPNLMYSQGTTGNASGAPYTKPLPAFQETPVDTQALMSGAIAAAQLKQINTQTEGMKIDNLKNAGTKESYIRQMILQNKALEESTKKTTQEIKNLMEQKKLTKIDATLKVSQKEQTEIDNKLKTLDLEFFNEHDLAPSDYGIIKGLKRLGVDVYDAIKWVLTADQETARQFLLIK